MSFPKLGALIIIVVIIPWALSTILLLATHVSFDKHVSSLVDTLSKLISLYVLRTVIHHYYSTIIVARASIDRDYCLPSMCAQISLADFVVYNVCGAYTIICKLCAFNFLFCKYIV